MPVRSGLSACIITLNEADRIDACLDSLAFCDEVVVVDSGSTDDTRERDSGFASHAGYRFPRATEYFGAYLRHGNAYPDRVLRLFDRRRGGWRGDREIHEHASVDGPVATLSGDLEHHAYRSLGDHLTRMDRYARMMAVHMHAQGRRAHLVNMFANPFWRFARGYVLRAGFLDGWRGLIYALVKSNYVRQKFIKLWLLDRGYPI